MGRTDKKASDSTAGLPNPCDTANVGIARFSTMGFTAPEKSLVVLSGAHNIGRSRVTSRGACSKGIVSSSFTKALGTSNTVVQIL
jgi:hypothetical protein